MKNNKFPMFGGSQSVGQEIIKIIETNKLVRWKNYDPAMREYEFQSPNGTEKIHESKITKKFTSQEEQDFLRSEQNTN
jgi:hypothetical protein